MNNALLKLSSIDTFYGPVQVHFGIDIEVGEGEIVCLLGSNASGKSTAMKVILGLLAPRAGTISFADDDITHYSTARRIRKGIASVPESRRIFGDMTVEENILMGAFTRAPGPAVRRDKERVLDLFPVLRHRIRQIGGTLSGGEQQMLAMARALMSNPRLICMDEPTMGLSPIWVDRVLTLVAELNRQGIGIFMVEQNAHQALSIAQRAYVLQNGHVVLKGPARELLNDPKIRDAYLGGEQMTSV